MRVLIVLLLVGSGFLGGVRGAEVHYEIAGLGVNAAGQSLYRYTYEPVDIVFEKDQELDIRFDPNLFAALFNALAPPDFDVLLLQPNTPPGAFGDYSALALVSNPVISSPFSVDVVFIGSGIPGAQPYFINQYDGNGQFVATVIQGATTSGSSAVVPEPGSLSVVSAGLCMLGISCLLRRRFRERLKP
jgi:hypothetical protein